MHWALLMDAWSIKISELHVFKLGYDLRTCVLIALVCMLVKGA
jgi:hypothetical protein